MLVLEGDGPRLLVLGTSGSVQLADGTSFIYVVPWFLTWRQITCGGIGTKTGANVGLTTTKSFVHMTFSHAVAVVMACHSHMCRNSCVLSKNYVRILPNRNIARWEADKLLAKNWANTQKGWEPLEHCT